MTTLLAFLAALALLIVVHEWGHYRMAVACGIKVLRFSVGFGRPLWRYQRTPDSTEFVIGSLPFGGYVQMLDEREGPVPVELARMAFNRKSVGHRALVVVAGPAANLVLAIVLYGLAAFVGIQEPRAVIAEPTPGSMAAQAGLRAGDWIREVRVSDSASTNSQETSSWISVRSYTELRWILMRAALEGNEVLLKVSDPQQRGDSAARVVGNLRFADFDPKLVDHRLFSRIGLNGLYTEPVIGQVQAGGAADVAGLRAGDRVLMIDDNAIPDGRTVIERVRSAGQGRGPTQVWQVERAGQRLQLAVTPNVTEETEGRRGRIGAFVGAPPPFDTIEMGLPQALLYGLQQTWDASALTLQVLGKMLIGEASLNNLSGPITIAEAAGQSANAGFAPYMVFLALVSVSLGVLNLLPLPMLDGGHLMYYSWEIIRGKPVPDAWLQALQKAGLALILLMMSLALFNDVSRLAGL